MLPGQDIAALVRKEFSTGWPLKGQAIQFPQVVWITLTELNGVVNNIDVNTVAGHPVVRTTHGVGTWWDILSPTISTIAPAVQAIRANRTFARQTHVSDIYQPSGVNPANVYLYAPCTDLMAPVVPPPEPWIGSDFLHIHVGPPASVLDFVMFTDFPSTAGVADATHPVDITTIPTQVGLAALQNVGRFQRYAIKVFGPQQAEYTVTGDGTPVPGPDADAADAANKQVTEFYRQLLKTHADIVNGLGIDNLSYEYLDGNPTANDILQLIAAHYGFSVG
jgi:hypothetical protein